ncbi:oligosaccharide flippase family protein [bacterium]|nr:oligosaccharide flippase family protein [bacterium]
MGMFEELKRFFGHSVVYGIGNIVGRLMGFLMIPVYTRYLSPKEYGLIEILDLNVCIISAVLIAGFAASLSKYYFYYKKEDDRKEVVSSALIFNVLTGFLGSLILFVFSRQFSLVFFKTDIYTYYFQLSFITLIFEACLSTPFAYLRVKEVSILYVTISILRMFLGLVLNIYFIVFLHMGILGVLYSGIIVGVISSLCLIYYTIKDVGISFSYSKLKEMFVFGVPLIPADLGMYLLNYLDRLFLNKFCSLGIIGVYALGCKLGMILNSLIGQPFTMIWVAFRFEIAEREDAKEIYARILTYFEFVLIFLTLGLIFFIKDIVSVIAGKEFLEAYKIVPLIAVSCLFFGANYVLRVGLYLEKKTKWVPITVWVPLILTVILSWIIIPKYNMMGAGIIKILSYFSMAATAWFISQRFYPISYEFKRILKMLLVAILLYLISFFLPAMPLWLSLIVKSLLTITFPILLYFFNFYDEKEKEKVRELWLNYNEKYIVR